MKIIKLTAENIKRLTAVEITPEGTLITVGGKNGAGKSSVLDAIAYALGGQALIPDKPIRIGQKEAKIEVDLGDVVVTRKFQLRSLLCNCSSTNNDTMEEIREPLLMANCDSDTPKELIVDKGISSHERLCDSLKEPQLSSMLTVKNPAGQKYQSPQAMLDGLFGRLSFDPLVFSRATIRNQAEILRDLVGLDVSKLDKERAIILAGRTEHNNKVKFLEAKLISMPKCSDAPEEKISMDEISQKIIEAEELRTVYSTLTLQVSAFELQYEQISALVQAEDLRVKKLEDTLKEHTIQLKELKDKAHQKRQQLSKAKVIMKEASTKVPSTEALSQELKQAEKLNDLVQARQTYIQVELVLSEHQTKVERATLKITAIDQEKRKKLAAIKFPIEGLDLDQNRVTFNGLPFDQASTAEQLRISVAIGLALNPKLKILLVRDGNALDSNSLKAIAEQAAQAEAQLWLERVAETKDGVTVMIEDGAVV